MESTTTDKDANIEPIRFLEEPKDAVGVVGQSIELSCVFSSQPDSAYWHHDKVLLSNKRKISLFVNDRYSLAANESANSDLAAPSAAQVGADQPQPQQQQQQQISNYSLHIKNVSPKDEGQFQCTAQTSNGEVFSSRLARLTLLRPPERLSISAALAADSSEEKRDQVNEEWPLIAAAGDTFQPNEFELDANKSQLPAKCGERKRSEIDRIVVKQNDRLRLECLSDLAKPQAELTWLDHEGRMLASTVNGSSAALQSGEQTKGGQLSEPASLSWTFTVHKNHSNQLFTCLGQHRAFREESALPELFGCKLRKQIRLEVQWKPEVELIKDQLHAFEGRPFKFRCQATGKPNQISYKWFIDGQLIDNATSSELRIERVTRQLHLREIRCEAANSVDSASDALRLAVRYPPAFVSHLLPPSLQPAELAGSAPSLPPTEQPRHSHRHRTLKWKLAAAALAAGGTQPRPPSGPELALARQLALGFEAGEDVQLHCDFDANPRLQQVLWYRINTDYKILRDVKPAEGDELIEFGGMHAIFHDGIDGRESAREQQLWSAPIGASPEIESRHDQHKRQADGVQELRLATGNLEGHLGDNLANLAAFSHSSTTTIQQLQERQLDYEQMSADLLRELDGYEQLARLATNGSQLSESQIVQPIENRIPSQTSVRIHEPLAWHLQSGSAPQQMASNGTNSSPANQRESNSIQSLRLVEPMLVNQFGSNEGADLGRREAQVSRSSIMRRNANKDTIGKYVCKTASSSQSAGQVEDERMSARGVFLVLKEQPRIVSCAEQWAPLSARQLQVECLAQINTVIDDVTSFSWSKNGKPIVKQLAPSAGNLANKDVQVSPAGESGEKVIDIIVQRSPDLLFLRSILVIENADPSDFGQYNCTITNSVDSDFLPINLKPSELVGKPFTVMAGILMATLLLLACIVGLLIVLTPQRRLEKKLAMANSAAASNCAASIEPVTTSSSADGSQSDRKSPRSLESQEEADERPMICMAQAEDNFHRRPSNCDNDANVRRQHNQQFASLRNHPDNFSATDSIGSFGRHQRHYKQQQQHQLRASLRQTIIQTTNGAHQRPRLANNKFAAIHESLEQQLSQRPALGFAMTKTQSGDTLATAPTANGMAEANQEAPNQGSLRVGKGETISELDTQTQLGLMNRLWSRLLGADQARASGKTRTMSTNSARRAGKSRPVISMPVNLKADQRIRRSSLSTSLSVLGSANLGATNSLTSINNANNNNNNNNQNTATSSLNLNVKLANAPGQYHLVSSSANLIQDSTTASDGTTTNSSRSSSSNGHHHNPNPNHHHNHHLTLTPNGIAQTASNSLAGYTSNLDHRQYPVQQHHHTLWMQPPAASGERSSPRTILFAPSQADQLQVNTIQGAQQIYANNQMVGNETTNIAYHPELSLSNPNQLYTNGHYQEHPNGGQMTTNGYISQPANWPVEQGNELAPPSIAHYQLPMLMTADTNYPFPLQDPNRSCYASVCSKPQQPLPQFGSDQEEQVRNQMVVPTSDAGDAYFESNYGTLISKSSAYKTLGYAMAQHQASHSPGSSASQSSMTTHANNTLTLIQDPPMISSELQQHLGDGDNNDTSNDSLAIILQQSSSNTSSLPTQTSILANGRNANSLATHV